MSADSYFPEQGPTSQDAPQGTSLLAVVGVVTSRAGVLAGRRRDGISPWTLPGGQVGPDESVGEAAEREVLEECG